MSRLDEIAREMLDLIDAPDIFGFLDDTVGNMPAVEARLQEVMMGRPQFETIELAMYLRCCFTRQNHLPTWQPLLNAAVEMGLMRGEDINDIFGGLMEQRPDPRRNTGHRK
jgi:hypothetical protein